MLWGEYSPLLRFSASPPQYLAPHQCTSFLSARQNLWAQCPKVRILKVVLALGKTKVRYFMVPGLFNYIKSTAYIMTISSSNDGINGTGNHFSGATNDPFTYNDPLEVPVLIVGGGPTGLLQAHLLAELQSTHLPSLSVRIN